MKKPFIKSFFFFLSLSLSVLVGVVVLLYIIIMREFQVSKDLKKLSSKEDKFGWLVGQY